MPRQDHFRAHGRMPVRVDAVVRRLDTHAAATIRNLGFGGAGLVMTQKTESASTLDLVAGDHVTLEIVTPVLWDPLHLRAVVAWCQPDAVDKSIHFGLNFEPLGSTPLLSLFDILCAH